VVKTGSEKRLKKTARRSPPPARGGEGKNGKFLLGRACGVLTLPHEEVKKRSSLRLSAAGLKGTSDEAWSAWKRHCGHRMRVGDSWGQLMSYEKDVKSSWSGGYSPRRPVDG